MQAIQPAAKKLQDKYKDRDPARLNQELQKLYADNQVNPLAGCLPSLAQIPIFIGLYRSLLALAKDDKITEPFLWIPSLEGPSADYTQGITWLTDGWVNGVPPLGWHDTLAYLVLPVVLTASQFVSTSILTPKNDDPAQAQSQVPASPHRHTGASAWMGACGSGSVCAGVCMLCAAMLRMRSPARPLFVAWARASG